MQVLDLIFAKICIFSIQTLLSFSIEPRKKLLFNHIVPDQIADFVKFFKNLVYIILIFRLMITVIKNLLNTREST